METFEKGDRVIFRWNGTGDEYKGTVTEDSDSGYVTVLLDEELHGITGEWTVHHTELTKTAYVSLDTLLGGE